MEAKIIIKNRDEGIDVIKFLATLMVINSHMSICYPKYDFLATGGAIGNSLFFFASGFTLFLGKMTDFPNYYKKRVLRIYPAVIAMGLFSGIILNSSTSFLDQLGAFWFVNCIMVYYVLLWIARYIKMNILCLIVVSLLFTIWVCLYYFDFKEFSLIYGESSLRVYLYFSMMVLGGYMGYNKDKYICKKSHWIMMIFSIVCWYLINHFFYASYIQLIGIPLLLSVCYFSYIVSKSETIVRLLEYNRIRVIIRFVGALCLEVYMIQFDVISSKLNFIFPLNIPIIIIACIMMGYCLSIFSRLVSQTFDKEPYNWRLIIKPFN